MDAFAKVILVEKEIVVQAFDDIRVIKVDDALYVEIYDERIENTINKAIKKLSQRSQKRSIILADKNSEKMQKTLQN